MEAEIAPDLPHCDLISVGMVYEANAIFMESYGDRADEKAMISFAGANPITSTLCLKLFEAGVIQSLDDDIRQYGDKYADCLPPQFSDTPVTFRHLLEHSSGLPGRNSAAPDRVWVNGRLNLQTTPGSTYAASDVDYAVIEDLLAEMTGKTYDRLLAESIGAPVCSSSIKALSPDDPNVAGVTCTLADLTKFMSHLLAGRYISGELIRTVAWEERVADNKGMGWDIMKSSDSDYATMAFAYSTHGSQEVYMACQPCGQIGAVIVFQTRTTEYLTNPFQTMFDLLAVAAYRHQEDRGGPHLPQWDIP